MYIVPPKSNFTYQLGEYLDEKYIIIIDQYQNQVNPGKTVTNDMENVVSYIGDKERIDPKQYKIFYRDSYGEWAGYNPDYEDFYFPGDDYIREVAKAVALKNKNR